MAKKRKKHPRLPNGWGSIRYLGGNRTNPYAVHPPTTEFDENGNWIRPKALCYVDDWYVGFAVLNAYRAGTYKPGDEFALRGIKDPNVNLDAFCRRMLADAAAYNHVEVQREEKTFSQVYDEFYEWKYGEHAIKKLSEQSRASTRAAYLKLKELHNKFFVDLRYSDMQEVINACQNKSATKENMVSLLHQMYRYAKLHDITDKDYSDGLQIADANDDEHGVPFTDQELQVLWEHSSDPTVEFMLIMCYSGYRIIAYKTLEVNTDSWYFQGGVKTPAGKGRIVPIHPAIRALVTARIERDGGLLKTSTSTYRSAMYEALSLLGIEKRTPHDCRHTFSRLCEKYGVNENDRKRMLGHSFGSDVTNAVYGHRLLEDLRTELEKIQTPVF